LRIARMGTGGVRSARRSECMRTRSKEKPPSALRESPGREGVPMPRYIGLDVHKRYVHACEFRPDRPEGQQERHFRFPNLELVLERLPATLELSFAALAFALLLAFPVGILSAVRPGSLIDHLGTVLALVGQ